MAPACYFFMLISSFRTKADIRKLIDTGIGFVSILALLMLLQFFFGFFSEITATYDHRLVWPYLDPLSGRGTSGNYPALFVIKIPLINSSEQSAPSADPSKLGGIC